MMRRSVAWPFFLAVALSLAACTSNDAATPSPSVSEAPSSGPMEAANGSSSRAVTPLKTYRLVTLGDSYTYGAGTVAPKAESWPAQVAAALSQRGDMRISLLNLADKSSPSKDVIEAQLSEVGYWEPDVVTVQVGVNDIVGSETDSYAENIALILDELRRILPAERIFAITTPDHTLTEWGKAYGSHEMVEELNAELIEAATERGITVIDIGPVNERVAVDDSLLVQEDPPRPYPTAKQYAGWAELIGLYIHEALSSVEP